ncbi:MAG: hypothetical protein ACJ788_03095 [Ktedonobacteraceae bacterium]
MGYNDTSVSQEQQDTPRRRPACPYCGSTETEFFSLFGQQLLTVQFYCNACHTPFEHVKDDDVLADYAARKESQP